MTQGDTHIIANNVRKAFDSPNGQVVVLDGLSLDIERGEFITFFGPNGCGKTTLLNVLTGVDVPDQGVMEIREPHKRPTKIGYVFQDYRGNLMPWLTVAENIAFPLKIKGVPKTDRRRRVEELMARFEFNLDLDTRTYALSGGQAQLVSILRAFTIEPDILVLDEPFSALDYQTNLSLYDKLFHMWEQTGVTILLVSHDLEEALYLGGRTVFLTKRPASVIKILNNQLPGEKNLHQMGTAAFATLKSQALDIFRLEVEQEPS